MDPESSQQMKQEASQPINQGIPESTSQESTQQMDSGDSNRSDQESINRVDSGGSTKSDQESINRMDGENSQPEHPLSPEVVEVKIEVDDDEIQLIENESDHPGKDFRPNDSDSNSRPDGAAESMYRDTDPLALPTAAQASAKAGAAAAASNPQYFFLLFGECFILPLSSSEND